MDHMNLFLPYKNKDACHEDVLTRNFLFMIKASPAVRKMFVKIVRDNTKSEEASVFAKLPNEFTISEVYTQVDNNNNIFNRINDGIILSTLISDDVFESDRRVQYSDRNARYDGVLVCEPNLWVVIENKPCVKNVWGGQLDLNMKGIGKKENLIRKPCCLSWRDVITGFNGLLECETLNETEKILIDDFLMYIDQSYVWLNPFNRLDLCKDVGSLIDKRCCSILKEICSGDIKYHRGWGYYASCNNPMIKMIALRHEENEKGWVVRLRLHFGVTQLAAQGLYDNISNERLGSLLNEDAHMSAIGAFHYAVQADNVFFPAGMDKCKVDEYVRYWKQQKRNNAIHQIKRSSFEEYHQQLINDNIVSDSSMVGFRKEIMGKRYTRVNICPELQICCTWSKDEAMALDKKGGFTRTVSEAIRSIMSIFDSDTDVGINDEEV